MNEGSTLADALVSTRRFDNLYVSMVRAGEASGALDAVLVRIADYSEDSVRLNNRVMSILTYPLFMLAFAGVVVGVMSTLVLPQITELLLSQDIELPWYTVAVIAFSDFLRGYWWLADPAADRRRLRLPRRRAHEARGARSSTASGCACR